MAVDLGIDLGTSTTLICDENGEVLLNEPSLVIKSNTSDQVVAIGSAASDMIGRGCIGNYADTRRSDNRI